MTIGGRFMLNNWIAFCYTWNSNYKLFQKPTFLGTSVNIKFLTPISSGRVTYLQKLF